MKKRRNTKRPKPAYVIALDAGESMQVLRRAGRAARALARARDLLSAARVSPTNRRTLDRAGRAVAEAAIELVAWAKVLEMRVRPRRRSRT